MIQHAIAYSDILYRTRWGLRQHRGLPGVPAIGLNILMSIYVCMCIYIYIHMIIMITNMIMIVLMIITIILRSACAVATLARARSVRLASRRS